MYKQINHDYAARNKWFREKGTNNLIAWIAFGLLFTIGATAMLIAAVEKPVISCATNEILK